MNDETGTTHRGRVEKIINGGWGLVRGDKGVVFLSFVLPGEEVVYRIKEKARGILWGELLDVTLPSPHRTQPPCPYFGQCGGCVFQHMAYDYQQTVKREILADDLKRIGGYDTPLPEAIASPPFNNRVRARMKGFDDGRIGFIRKSTNQVIPIDHCLLFPDAVNQFLTKWNHQDNPPFFFQLDIFYNPDEQKVYIHLSHPPDDPDRLTQGFPDIVFSWKGREETSVSTLTVNQHQYRVSPAVFFQVNPHQWANMLDTAASFMTPCHSAVDLYCGVGFFIPLLQKHAPRVVGVENRGLAVDLAEQTFGGQGTEFFKGPAEKFPFPKADTLLVDPPRSGLSSAVMKAVLHHRFDRIIYVSCSSATFSRDLRLLREGGYEAKALRLLDLFPQTAHMETITLFEPSSPK